MTDEETTLSSNAAFARIPLSEARLRELPIEINQFTAAIEKVRPALVFESEPADFLTVLETLAWLE
jgi:hypothetical protein